MVFSLRLLKGICCAVLVLVVALPSKAQIANQLSAYTGPNAEGYLKPLADAFGANLNDGFFHSAHIPTAGPHFSFEIRVMSVFFADEDRTFSAKSEANFDPETTVDAPTIVGSGDAKIVSGNNNTQFAFPGGFNLNSFAIAVPQIRVGAVKGTEAVIRFFALDTGDAELGDIKLFGIGGRHSISQYFDELPVSLAGSFFWQTMSMGEDLLDTKTWSFGAQASKRFTVFEPYTGVSFDSYKTNVKYESNASGSPQKLDVDFESENTLHLTLGVAFRLPIISAYGEYNVASTNSLSFGVAFGN